MEERRQHRLERPGNPGHFFQISMERCRTFVAWGVIGGATSADSSAWESATVAAKSIDKKIKKKEKEGFREVSSCQFVDWVEPSEHLVDTFNALREIQNRSEEIYKKIEIAQDCFKSETKTMISYWVVNPSQTRGLQMNVDRQCQQAPVVHRTLAFLADNVEEVLSVEPSAFFELDFPESPFEGVVVFSAWAAMPQRAIPSIATRVGWAVPGYRSEVSGKESVLVSETRMRWLASSDPLRSDPLRSEPRKPCPLIEARFDIQGNLGGKSRGAGKRFLVWKPTDLPLLLTKLEQGAEGSWLEIRNFENQVARLVQSIDGPTLEGEYGQSGNLEPRMKAFIHGTGVG